MPGVKRAVFLSLFLCSLGSICSAAEPSQQLLRTAAEIQDLAIKALQTGLKAEKFWVRVHAAEFLLDLGQSDSLEATVSRELEENGQKSPERIGAWRLAYRMADSAQARDIFEHKILSVAKDASATDHLHAVETLAKLNIQLPESELQGILAITREAGTDEHAFGLWLAVVQRDNGNREQLQEQLASLMLSDDQITKLRSAYALWSLSNESPMVRDIIIDAGVRSAEQELKTELEKMAGARNMATAWKVARLFGVDDDIEAGKEASIQKFSTALKQGADQSQEVAKILSDTLAELGSPEDRERLLKYLAADHDDLRVSAAHALLRIQIRMSNDDKR
ncbi:hypothetical protein [Aeoliella mucimassa]|uniref:HEAT repeat protein n=1 Tax=Aeoliella mucimassa TaxID=2527972 RepID=A0A518AQ71_9BACT|nr:hypothetical protein [Aeoliella mucimassa]QDU56870.1 hypothetical protein Pan181_30820 [Aeoliella mucimassa]